MFSAYCFNNVCTFDRNKIFMNSHLLYKVFKFYVDGFRSMTVGKTLWMIIGIKLFIMFAVLKLFFFPNFLKSNFDNDSERSEYVIEQLTK
jgi:hypothetical protein